jgi:hypothetical protein
MSNSIIKFLYCITIFMVDFFSYLSRNYKNSYMVMKTRSEYLKILKKKHIKIART